MRLNQILTSVQVAKILQLHPSTLVKCANEGRIPFFKTPGGHRRFIFKNVLAYAQKENLALPMDLVIDKVVIPRGMDKKQAKREIVDIFNRFKNKNDQVEYLEEILESFGDRCWKQGYACGISEKPYGTVSSDDF